MRERLAQMERAARRSLAMIETLLDFSESRFQGALRTRPVMADPAEIAPRVIEELRAAHPRAGASISTIESRGLCALDPVPASSRCWPTWSATPSCTASTDTPVEVSIEVPRRPRRCWRSRNRGPVIPPEQVARLFEPFTRGAALG